MGEMNRPEGLSRRGILSAGLLAGAGYLLNGVPVVSADTAAPAPAAGVLRFAFLTDMHVQPERQGEEGYAAALRSAESHKPSFLVTGGDHVMDCFGQYPDRAEAVWKSFHRAHAANRLPWYPVVGNHDVFGWGTEVVAESHASYGKRMTLDQLRLKQTYYSFDHGPWHFVVLDNIARRGRGYLGELGDEQTAWLRADLAAAGGRPVCVFTHIPLLAVCVLFDGERFKPDGKAYDIPDSYMHHDVKPLLDLFAAHNVRLCVSGHIHQVDRVDYRGITFVCAGAVSGGWWKGPNKGFPEGYALFDLHPDGSVQHRYVTYGWQAAKE